MSYVLRVRMEKNKMEEKKEEKMKDNNENLPISSPSTSPPISASQSSSSSSFLFSPSPSSSSPSVKCNGCCPLHCNTYNYVHERSTIPPTPSVAPHLLSRLRRINACFGGLSHSDIIHKCESAGVRYYSGYTAYRDYNVQVYHQAHKHAHDSNFPYHESAAYFRSSPSLRHLELVYYAQAGDLTIDGMVLEQDSTEAVQQKREFPKHYAMIQSIVYAVPSLHSPYPSLSTSSAHPYTSLSAATIPPTLSNIRSFGNIHTPPLPTAPFFPPMPTNWPLSTSPPSYPTSSPSPHYAAQYTHTTTHINHNIHNQSNSSSSGSSNNNSNTATTTSSTIPASSSSSEPHKILIPPGLTSINNSNINSMAKKSRITHEMLLRNIIFGGLNYDQAKEKISKAGYIWESRNSNVHYNAYAAARKLYKHHHEERIFYESSAARLLTLGINVPYSEDFSISESIKAQLSSIPNFPLPMSEKLHTRYSAIYELS